MLYLRQSGSERLSISHDRNPTATRLSWLRRCCGFGLGCVQGTIILDEGQELHGQKHSGETYFSISRRAGGRYRTQHTYSPVFERGQHAAAGQYRQEMKWGCFVKKWTFPRRRVHYVQCQYFYFTFYLFGGCVRTQRTPPPCLRACHRCGLWHPVLQQLIAWRALTWYYTIRYEMLF